MFLLFEGGIFSFCGSTLNGVSFFGVTTERLGGFGVFSLKLVCFAIQMAFWGDQGHIKIVQ